VKRATLSRLGVPERCHDDLLDEWHRDLDREAVRLAAATLKDQVDAMPPEARAAVHSSLMALTPELAASQAHVTTKTIRRAVTSGKIMAVRGSTGLLNLDRDSFEKWHAARRPTFCPACPPLSKP